MLVARMKIRNDYPKIFYISFSLHLVILLHLYSQSHFRILYPHRNVWIKLLDVYLHLSMYVYVQCLCILYTCLHILTKYFVCFFFVRLYQRLVNYIWCILYTTKSMKRNEREPQTTPMESYTFCEMYSHTPNKRISARTGAKHFLIVNIQLLVTASVHTNNNNNEKLMRR